MTDIIERLIAAVITEVNPDDGMTYMTKLGEEAAGEIERLRETLACAFDDWEGRNGRLTDKDDPHWSNDAIRLLEE